jgi:hypothetical protein
VGKGQLSFSLELAGDRVLIDQGVELLRLSGRDILKDQEIGVRSKTN